MSNSSLISCTVLSPNHSGKRTMPIDRISIHCMAGNLSVESCGSLFAKSSRQASSNYGIGSDGRIGLYVDEANRSWCTSSRANDQRAVTIEVANTVAAHPWPVSDKAYAALIKLCVDICKRNGKNKVVWFPDKDTALAYEPKAGEMVLTVHRWFAAKACPGDDLFNDHPDIVKKVNAQIGGTATPDPEPEPEPTTSKKTNEEIAKEVYQGKWGNGADRKNRLTAAGYDYAAVQALVSKLVKGESITSTTPASPTIVKATGVATKLDKSLAGTYTVTASSGLNVRNAAGTAAKVLVTIPKGTKVKNYGYYTPVNGVKWLLVQFTYKGVTYTGFCSGVYLTK